jgi:NAD(P)-dependent dehydrogenase (short-subunit alcohol dehydrogenase family)
MSVAIVTGASRGLGYALASGLAEVGWRLVIDARAGAALATAAEALARRTEVVALRGDITHPAHRAELVAAARHLAGDRGFDLLVNNAGILGPSPQPAMADYPLQTLRDVYEANVFAPLALTQLALPALRASGGAIVNVTSDAAAEPYPGWGGYGSAKAALEQASRVLAEEEQAVRVWCVDPGDLRTRMHQEAFPGEDISDRPLPQTAVPAFLRLIAARPASGRFRAADLLAEPADALTPVVAA